MSTPNHTGITQPLDQIVATLCATTPEKRAEMLARINAETSATHRNVTATVIAPTPATLPSQPEPLSASEQKDLTINLLDTTSAQYDTSYAAWKSTFQLDPKYLQSLATKDTVMAWVKTLPPATIQAILKYGPPRLKLLTEIPVPDLLEVLNQHKTIPGQKDSVIWWDQWKTIAAKPGEFGLTPDTEDMPQEGICQGRKNPAIIAEYKRRFEQTPRSTTMPQAAYLPSAMDELARGKVYDRHNWTGFEQPQGAARVPGANWGDGHVFLDRSVPGHSYGGLRGRLWVRGEKKN